MRKLLLYIFIIGVLEILHAGTANERTDTVNYLDIFLRENPEVTIQRTR